MKKTFQTTICLFGLIGLIAVGASAQMNKTRITVALDGSGDFTSIEKAVESCKSFPYQTITIYIKNGIYHEKVRIPAWNTKISLVGQSKDSTILTYGDSFNKIDKGPNSTFYTATLLVQGNDFQAENLTVENSAGPVGQAIALDVEADRCSMINCRILGNQDTLYAAGENARQYFYQCIIEGTTDFIFGEATALFEDCTLKCKANSFITAASTSKNTAYGFVFKNCTLVAASGVHKVYLGRPWRRYAKTVYTNCRMGSFIAPAGWYNWNDPDNEKTVFYAEYHSSGAGANPAARVSWSKQLTGPQAMQYDARHVFSGNREWLPPAR